MLAIGVPQAQEAIVEAADVLTVSSCDCRAAQDELMLNVAAGAAMIHQAIDLAIALASGAVIVKSGGKWFIRKAGQEVFEEISERQAVRYLDDGVEEIIKRNADDAVEQVGKRAGRPRTNHGNFKGTDALR